MSESLNHEPYRILIQETIERGDVFGSGGFSQILSVPHRPDVVLKWTKPGGAGEVDAELALQGARSEAVILSKIQHHPNIIVLYHACEVLNNESGSGFFMVLEAGLFSLHTLISQHHFIPPGSALPLSLRERILLMNEVRAGLLHVHSHGFMHGDVTSANVMMVLCGSSLVSKLVDFGFSCRKSPQERQESLSTSSQSRCFSRSAGGGTPGYIADETTNQPQMYVFSFTSHH